MKQEHMTTRETQTNEKEFDHVARRNPLAVSRRNTGVYVLLLMIRCTAGVCDR